MLMRPNWGPKAYEKDLPSAVWRPEGGLVHDAQRVIESKTPMALAPMALAPMETVR